MSKHAPKAEGKNEAENLMPLGNALLSGEADKPLIQCPGNNRLVLEFVTELAPILAAGGFYQRANRAVTIERVRRKDRFKRDRLTESIIESTPASPQRTSPKCVKCSIPLSGPLADFVSRQH